MIARHSVFATHPKLECVSARQLVGARINTSVSLAASAAHNLLLHQVPLRVATACCKVLQQSSSASSSRAAAPAHPNASVQELPASTWRAHCLELPHLLLNALLRLDLEQAEPTPGAPAALMGQQFQQSGFLELLPQLLQDTADQLQAAAAAAAQTVPSSATSSGASSSTVSPTQPRTSQQGTAAALPKLTQQDWHARPDKSLLKGAFFLFGSYTILAKCWTRGKFAFELVPACAPAVVQLASISFQQVSHLLEHHQMDAFSYKSLAGLWVHADESVRLALIPDVDPTYSTQSSLSFLGSSGMQQYHSVLFDSPHTGQCLAVMLASAVYSTLLLQLPRLPDVSVSSDSSRASGSSASGSSNSSSSSSSNNGGGGTQGHPARKLQALQCTDASKAWQFACEEHQLLPSTHHKLLQGAGCSSRSVLFAAVCTAAWWKSATAPALQHTLAVHGIYRRSILHKIYHDYTAYHQRMRDQPRQQQHHISQEQRQQQLLFCLMPGVLLYYAALQPPTVPPGVPVNVHSAVCSSRSAIAVAMQLAGHSSSLHINHSGRKQPPQSLSVPPCHCA